jgi:hypothetical protein
MEAARTSETSVSFHVRQCHESRNDITSCTSDVGLRGFNLARGMDVSLCSSAMENTLQSTDPTHCPVAFFGTS